MLDEEGRDPGDVGIADAPAFMGELVDGDLDVGRVQQRDGIQRQAEGIKLLLLFVPMGFSDLAALAVAGAPGQAVSNSVEKFPGNGVRPCGWTELERDDVTLIRACTARP